MTKEPRPEDYPIIGRGWAGTECGDGWNDILHRLFARLEAEARKYPPGEEPCLLQVKEKFGELRVYMSHSNDAMAEAIDQAALESCQTCELCGRYGGERRKPSGWVVTRCELCHE